MCLCVSDCVCVHRVCVYVCWYMCVCICVLACEIWVCLFRVFFPSVMVQPGCCVCMRVFVRAYVCVCVRACMSEKFHLVYSTVENERLQERKGKEGLSHTSTHVRKEECKLFYIQVSFPTAYRVWMLTYTHVFATKCMLTHLQSAFQLRVIAVLSHILPMTPFAALWPYLMVTSPVERNVPVPIMPAFWYWRAFTRLGSWNLSYYCVHLEKGTLEMVVYLAVES